MSILIFILGILIGSFLNVSIYRMPRDKSIVFPPSHCPQCGTPLKWINLIPIISYLIQRGSCGYCGEGISPHYPIVELVNGILYIILYNKFGLGLDFIFYSLIFSALIVIFFIDLEHQIIPNRLNLFIFLTSLLFKTLLCSFYNRPFELLNSLLGLIVSGGIFLLIILLSRGGMGGGDMKLIGVLGFILGLEKIVLTILISFILGAFISIILLLLKIKDRKDPIAFGPFICLAFMVTVFWGNKILAFYFNLL